MLSSEGLRKRQQLQLQPLEKCQNHIRIGRTMNLLTTGFPRRPLIHPMLPTSLVALVLSPTTLFLLVSPLNQSQVLHCPVSVCQ